MARPDIKDQRREQILDAFSVCIARYGLDGATLAKTAEVAGMARPLVRHNVGNRSDLLAAFVDRLLEKSAEGSAMLVSQLPLHNRSGTLIDWLFDTQYSDKQNIQVSHALIVASADDPTLSEKMQVWIDNFIEMLKQVIRSDYPDASPKRITAIATGISGIYFNVEALYPLQKAKALRTASKRAARILLSSLED
ncbi:MAG: TetR/AcrR family transcriptional regulator [Pseudomonadota bacterium]